MSDERLVSVVRRRPVRPAGALVLLHGRGTDETDLAPLLDELDPQRRLVGVTLRAPLRLGAVGYHWYVVRELGHPDPASFLDTYERVAGWLDELPASTGVPLEATVLGGFSQGAVMAYALGLGLARPSPAALRRPERVHPAGAGLHPGPGRVTATCRSPSGTARSTGSSRSSSAGRRRGSSAKPGLQVDYRESPMPHTIDPAFVQRSRAVAAAALERRLAA